MRPWSFSRLKCYTECPKQYFYRYVEHVESKREKPAADRGQEIHDKCEDYLNGKIPIYPSEIQKVAGHAMLIKRQGLKPEVKLAVDENWKPVDYESPDVYIRAIIDIIGMEGTVLHVQDWKTGKVYDSHKVQLDTYVAIAAASYPEATEFRSRCVYIDSGEVSKPKIQTPSHLPGIRLIVDAKIVEAEHDQIFPVKPGSICRFCDFSKRNGGPCAH